MHSLLLALPLTEEDFLCRHAAGDIGDVVRLWSRRARNSPSEAWRRYQANASLIRKMCAHATSRGWRVVPNATLADFSEAFGSGENVTLFAHWKGHRIFDYDILCANQITKILIESRSDSALLLRQIMGFNFIERISALREQDDAPVLLRELSEKLNEVVLFYDLVPTAASCESVLIRRFQNRDFLEQLFQGGIRQGNRLELWDQLASVDTVADAIPDSFTEVLDLTVCNSIILGEYLSKAKRCTMLVNAMPTILRYRIALFNAALDFEEKLGTSYFESILRAREAIRELGEK